MKIWKFIFLLTLITSQSFAQLPTDGLKAYWTFSGNAEDQIWIHDGIIAGEVTLTEDRFGSENCAYNFDGQQTSVILVQGMDDFNVPQDSSLSISLWFKGGSDEAGDLENLFIKNGELNVFHEPAYGISMYDLNKILMDSPNNETWINDYVYPFPADNNWRHVVAVFEPQSWRIYIDNVLIVEEVPLAPGIGFFGSDITMGAGYEGDLDDIAFYRKALSTQEIDQLFNMPSSCSTTGLSTVDSNSALLIYPNPVNDILTVGTDHCQELSLYDSQGRLIVFLLNPTSREEIDMRKLETGTYFLSVRDQLGRLKSRIVLKN